MPWWGQPSTLIGKTTAGQISPMPDLGMNLYEDSPRAVQDLDPFQGNPLRPFAKAKERSPPSTLRLGSVLGAGR